jgi:DNA transformation protein and related proteins
LAEDFERIAELFAGFGPIQVRRMFSGAGVFAEGLMIGLVVDGVIYLKADERTIADFQREGRAPFQYRSRDGARTLHSYWRMPERLYDDPDEMAEWARRSADCARRADAAKAAPRGKVTPRRKK